MSRDGGIGKKKTKKATIKNPDPKSKNSKKRANRNFKSLEQSTRLGRRIERKQVAGRIFEGKDHKPGEKNDEGYTAAGSNRYH